MAHPSITVITPAYNRELTIGATVRSVLSQTISDFEMVIVDDGSAIPVTDAIAESDDPRVRVIRHAHNQGASAARNTALAHARAPLVAQLDSDDQWKPQYLERVLPLMADPQVGLVYTDASVIGSPGRERYIEDRGAQPVQGVRGLLPVCPIPSATVTMRTQAVRAVGGYDRRRWSTQDWHLYLKLAHAGWRFDYVDEALAEYTWAQGPSSISFHTDRVKRDFLGMWIEFALRHPSTIPAHASVLPVLARGMRKQVVARLRPSRTER